MLISLSNYPVLHLKVLNNVANAIKQVNPDFIGVIHHTNKNVVTEEVNGHEISVVNETPMYSVFAYQDKVIAVTYRDQIYVTPNGDVHITTPDKEAVRPSEAELKQVLFDYGLNITGTPSVLVQIKKTIKKWFQKKAHEEPVVAA